MKNIVELTVTQVRIYPLDCLPFADLRVPTNAVKLKESFKFGAVQPDPFGTQLAFSNGIFLHRNKSFNVLSMTFEARKLTVQFRGHSAAADAFYSAVVKILNSIGDRSTPSNFEPLLKVEDTTCVATLDVDFSDLVAASFWRFIQTEGKQKLAANYGKPKSIAFKSLSFEIRYEPTDPRLEEYDVALSNKLLTIEPRVGTPLSERRFFASSPTDSETHISILEGLESAVAGVRK